MTYTCTFRTNSSTYRKTKAEYSCYLCYLCCKHALLKVQPIRRQKPEGQHMQMHLMWWHLWHQSYAVWHLDKSACASFLVFRNGRTAASPRATSVESIAPSLAFIRSASASSFVFRNGVYSRPSFPFAHARHF